MAQDNDEVRAAGFKRGLEGKSTPAGLTQGWHDDRISGPARTEGFIAGKRKRSRSQAEAAKRAKD